MKAIKRLPDAELEVMQALWSCTPPASRSDIETVLQSVHPMAVTTLLTVLTRLGEKGFLRIEKAITPPSLPKRIIWPPRAAPLFRRCAGAACPPSPPPCATAA